LHRRALEVLDIALKYAVGSEVEVAYFFNPMDSDSMLHGVDCNVCTCAYHAVASSLLYTHMVWSITI